MWAVVHEVIVPYPTPLIQTTEVRSTLLCASLQSLRARGLFDAYLSHLSPEQQVEVHALTAGLWLPVERAVTHYEACDRLPLTREDRLELGGDVAHRIQQSLLSVIARLARESGVTPWLVLANAEKLRRHTWQGGGIRITKTAPKDARVEWTAQPCARFAHFRDGFAGILRALCDLYARRTFVFEDPQTDVNTVSMRVHWA